MKALEAIREAVKVKELKKDNLIEKLQRVENCKKEYLSTYKPIYIPKVSEGFNSQESKKILEQYKQFKTTGLV